MRISGTKPSSVVLSQRNSNVMPQKCENKGWYKPRKKQFQLILIRKFGCSQNATNKPKSTVELGYMCTRGLIGPPSATLTK